ncbi:hypothetical protein C7A07_22300 [Pseudomonas fragi]|nr:hypothetical protein C7A07_22300 [Pseudomonas fragi]
MTDAALALWERACSRQDHVGETETPRCLNRGQARSHSLCDAFRTPHSPAQRTYAARPGKSPRCCRWSGCSTPG